MTLRIVNPVVGGSSSPATASSGALLRHCAVHDQLRGAGGAVEAEGEGAGGASAVQGGVERGCEVVRGGGRTLVDGPHAIERSEAGGALVLIASFQRHGRENQRQFRRGQRVRGVVSGAGDDDRRVAHGFLE